MKKKSTGVETFTCRHYFCKEINSYEEFYNIAPDDQLQLDDDHRASMEVDGVMEKVNSDSSHFYCKPIDSYEELYSLVGTEQHTLDDCTEICWYFYGKNIDSYEELLNVTGSL